MFAFALLTDADVPVLMLACTRCYLVINALEIRPNFLRLTVIVYRSLGAPLN